MRAGNRVVILTVSMVVLAGVLSGAADIRESILLSVGIIASVSVVGAGLSFLVSRDLTSRKRIEEALREQTRRDPLTGVLNHAAVVEELRTLLSSDGDRRPCAVAMVDVDGMKATNDTYGHQVGDAALKAVAQALSQDSAILGRYGGDEFVAVIEGADRTAAERYRQGVLDRLAQAKLVDPESGLTVPLSVTIGLAVHPEEAQTVTDLIKLSDNAMYASRLRRPQPPNAEGMPRRRDEQALKMVGEIVPLLTSEGSLNDKLRLVAHRLSVGAGYDAVDFSLFAPEPGAPVAQNTFAWGPEALLEAWNREQRADSPEPHPIRLQFERTSRPVILNDPWNDRLLLKPQRDILRAAELKSVLVAPMIWHNQIIGSLGVASRRKAALGPRDAQFVTTVATQVTAIVRMAMLLEELQSVSSSLAQSHEETVLLLAAAAEAHDETTGLHLQRVRTITEALARELDYGAQDAQDLGLAAVLHDIGKIRVPEGILVNSGELSAKEWEVMKHHTFWGEEFLSGRRGFELAATIARSHHERWDGTGYPDGLAGEAIPDAAAIVSVADSFDAMTSRRSYRSSQSIEAAVAEIVACSDKQFSPRVAEALVRLHERGALPLATTLEQAAA